MSAIKTFSKNIPYLKQQTKALLGNTSPTVKFICIVTICGYILSFSDTAIKLLSVTPGYFWPPKFFFWTAFTFCFIEKHIWEVLVDIITVGLCGKLIEPLWGNIEMLTFFTITNLGVAILTSTYYLFLYICTKNTDILYQEFSGLAGYVAGVSVSIREIMPDHLIARTPIGKFTNRNVPMTVFFVSLILWLVGLLEGTHPTMFLSGMIVSWVYLRFFQRHANGSRGFLEESFSFISFFPNVLQPAVSIFVRPLGLFIYKICNIKPLPPRTNSSLSSSNASLHGLDHHDMERRRQIALKALSERLSQTSDSKRQNLVPKSFPQQTKHQHQHHHQHQQHQQHHQHPGQQLKTGTIPKTTTTESVIVDLTTQHNIIPTTITPSTIATSSSSSSITIDTNNLINLDTKIIP